MRKKEMVIYWLIIVVGTPVIIYGMALEPSQGHGIGWLVLIETSGTLGLVISAVVAWILIKKG